MGQLNSSRRWFSPRPGASGPLLVWTQPTGDFPEPGSDGGTELFAEILEAELVPEIPLVCRPQGTWTSALLQRSAVGWCAGAAFPMAFGVRAGWGIPDCSGLRLGELTLLRGPCWPVLGLTATSSF